MADYDVSEALSKIEDMLISSMMRKLRHHLDLEKQDGISYTQWQAEQLAALADFRESTNTALGNYFKEFNERIGEALQRAYEAGGTEQETKILEALRKGWKRRPHSGQLSGSFFRINERRLNAYIASVKSDMERAEYALMRMADDQYRKAIFNAGVAYNTGAVTLPQAVDQATNDFLSRGLNCIQYRNGRRVNIDAYAEMAVRTSVTRSYLQGESAKRDEWGVNTVIVNRRGVACPKCLQYVGRVFYDDVYGHVKPQDGRYPLLSSAIAGGLYHPNCKDIHTTYFEGVSTPPEPLTKAEEQKAAEVYDLEQRQRYHERQIRKYKRLSEWTNDPKEKQKYAARLSGWQKLNADFVEEHGDVLKRRREREVARDIRPRVPAPPELLSGKSGVDKSGESGIIEITRKKNGAHRRTNARGMQVIDKPTYNKLTADFLKHDGLIIRGEEAARHLGDTHYASYLPSLNTAFIRDDATISEVLEEMYHAEQDRKNMFGDTLTTEVWLRREIDAQKYLLSLSEKYKIPQEEIEVTKGNLEQYEAELKKLLGGE